MRPMRADGVIELSEEQRAELTTVSRSRRTPQAVAQRARIVLMTAEGIAPVQIASELGVSQPTIRKWRARYVEDGLAGLRNEQRPGRPRTLSDQRVAELLNKAMSLLISASAAKLRTLQCVCFAGRVRSALLSNSATR